MHFKPKYRHLTPNTIETAVIFTHAYPFYSSHSIPHNISIDQKSHMNMKLMLKIKKFSNRSQTNGIIDL